MKWCVKGSMVRSIIWPLCLSNWIMYTDVCCLAAGLSSQTVPVEVPGSSPLGLYIPVIIFRPRATRCCLLPKVLVCKLLCRALGSVYYLDRLSVRWDDAEGSWGRLGASGAAGADCCHGYRSWCSGGGGGGYSSIRVRLLLSRPLSLHPPGHTHRFSDGKTMEMKRH